MQELTIVKTTTMRDSEDTGLVATVSFLSCRNSLSVDIAIQSKENWINIIQGERFYFELSDYFTGMLQSLADVVSSV